MRASHHRSRPRRHRTVMHPRRGVCRVPVEHVSAAVSVPVRAEIEEPEAPEPIPEWRTDTWKYRVEAEAVHHLESSLRGLGGVR